MFTIAEIIEATNGKLTHGDPRTRTTGLTTDTRTLKKGEVFIALTGPNFNGHAFVPRAFALGAAAAIVGPEFDVLPGSGVTIQVKDTLRAYGDLAAYHRSLFDIPIIAITGSNGKSTTKEMTAAILRTRGLVLKTKGNLNNLIGMPRTLLELNARHQAAVLELGMSEPGEIARLTEIAKPTVGVVTNVAPAHLLDLQDLAGVARAKEELYQGLPSGATAVINRDNPMTSAMEKRIEHLKITFGRTSGCDIQAMTEISVSLDGTNCLTLVQKVPVTVEIPHIGPHHVDNAMAAMAASLALGIEPVKMAQGLRNCPLMDSRTSLQDGHRGTILLDDSYNANPGSVKAALATLLAIRGPGRPMAVLGDMLELGSRSEELHLEIGQAAARAHLAFLVTMGPESLAIARGAVEAGMDADLVKSVETAEEATTAISAALRPGDRILIKGSRGMRLERVTRQLMAGVS